MTPKEKAEQIFNKMLIKAYEVDCLGGEYMIAKRCALIAVDEIFDLHYPAEDLDELDDHITYWEEVKQEIEKL
jgi:hypothetical protein